MLFRPFSINPTLTKERSHRVLKLRTPGGSRKAGYPSQLGHAGLAACVFNVSDHAHEKQKQDAFLVSGPLPPSTSLSRSLLAMITVDNMASSYGPAV